MKKRVFSVILAIALLLTMLPTAAFADGPNISIATSVTEVSQGGTFTVTLSVPSIETKAYNVAFRIGFDKSVFEVSEFTAPQIAGSTLSVYSEVKEANTVGEVSCSYEGTAQENTIDLSSGITVVVTFAVKNDAVAGSYDFTVDVTKNYAKSVADDGYTETDLFTVPSGLKTTVTVVEDTSTGGEGGDDDGGSGDEGGDGEGETADGYTVNLVNPSNDLVAVDGSVALNVTVDNVFNSAEITLSYDTNYLDFETGTVASSQVMGDQDQKVSITEEKAGVITIIDCGVAFAAGAAYTLNFTAKAATTGSEVEVTSAGLSTAEKATGSDLTKATTLGTVSVPVGYTVTINDSTGVEGLTFTASPNPVRPDGTVTITAGNPNYTYMLSATGGTLTTTTNGWTVSSLIGNVEVTVTSATPKQFSVTIDGGKLDNIDITNGEPANTATYGTDYVFALKADVVGGTGESTWNYTVTKITIGGKDYSFATTNHPTYTIPGDAITGDIVITTNATETKPNNYRYRVEKGDDVTLRAFVHEDGVDDLVAPGGTITLTLTPETGFNYTVTYTMGGGETKNVTFGAADQNGVQTATIENVTGNVVITATRELDTNFKVTVVSGYVAMDGKTVHLIKVAGNLDEDYTYTVSCGTYANNARMYNSGNHNAYAYLVITDAETTLAVENITIGFVKESAVILGVGDCNVNGSDFVDANDAQLVWNMYNATYTDFTVVSMEKFLRADVDGSDKIDMTDAAAIVSAIQNSGDEGETPL